MLFTHGNRSRQLDRALRPFSKVRPGEGPLALLLLLCVFLILAAYYMLKTAREGLILSRGSFGLKGDELKTYATAAMALLLMGLVPAYSALADRVRRIRLINVTYVAVVGCLLAFYVLARAGVPIGLAFFIWLGLVSVFLIAQFWSYANDLYTEEQGTRLFAIIALGGSIGAIVGPKLANTASTLTLLPMAALILAGSLVLFNLIERVHAGKVPATERPAPLSGSGGFSLVLHDRYLMLIALMLLVMNVVNSTGEYVLSNAAREHAAELVPAFSYPELVGAAREAAIEDDRREAIKAFYSDFFVWVNVLAFLLQAFLVSRVIHKLGVRYALFVLPVVAFGAYAAIGVIGGVALIRMAKMTENSIDYSLQNTVRQTLFLPTSRAVKYKAKAAIDTFFVRAGDMLSAIVVGFGLHQLDLGARGLAFVNLALIAIWIGIAFGIAHHYSALNHSRAVPA